MHIVNIYGGVNGRHSACWQVMRFCDNRERDCVLARAECTRELKKAREAWMAAEKVRREGNGCIIAKERGI